MSNNDLKIFDTTYTDVAGFKAKDTSDNEITYINPSGTETITENGTYDITGYSGVRVAVSGGGGAANLSDLGDTAITSPTNGQILQYNSTTSKWENETITIPTKTSDLTNDSGFMTGMTILSYGHSTWADFIDVYTNKRVVYCRASSSANPATGSQTRLAFMAYVNNADNPTEVEFQYYRTVNGHTDAQQGDQVYIYKLNKSSGWTVTTREAYTKIITGTGLSKSYTNGVSASMTLSLDSTKTATTSANGLMSSTDKSRLDDLYADYSSALTVLGVS